MKLQYDIDQCGEILRRLEELIDCIDSNDETLYSELTALKPLWESNASLLFLQKVYNNEENYFEQLILFKEALATLIDMHKDYCDVKELVDNKFREIRNG